MVGGNLHPAVQWAEEQLEVDPAILAKVKLLILLVKHSVFNFCFGLTLDFCGFQIKIAFIRNLPVSADENYLKKLFEPFGEVGQLQLQFEFLVI